MKAFATPRGGRTPPPSECPLPSSHKQRPPRVPKENVDPSPPPADRSAFRSPVGKPLAVKNRIPAPARPPLPSNPLKRKLSLESHADSGDSASQPSDSGVQVIVRIRPPSKQGDEADLIVQKVAMNAVSILDHTFTFDSVADVKSTQEDVFRLVGLPLVDNSLAGFNSSIFAYGQTGSGKTYTMWGPPSALSEHASSSTNRGLTSRVFEMLFARIDEEQRIHSDKELSYECRCSFLEIYNEQITDLLDPTQRNLQIREDVKTGVYVDSLTEEFVSTVKDINQLLIKGLANRRTGATSINVESSRSHCVFTCIIESRSKSKADGLTSFKSRRINLVDLAGSERQKQTGAAGERLKEAGNINRSLSQLGNLINVLAEVSQSGRQRHIPYRDSKLTFLLQESLGGNAKLAMICAISPSRSCKSETLSTLRFAQRAKAIQNKAVVIEIKKDDVNVLRDQIRELKEELQRMKSYKGPSDNSGGCSTGWNHRRSLHLLKMSLKLPAVEDDSDEEMEIDENDVEMPCVQLADKKNDVLGDDSAENGPCILADPSTLPQIHQSPISSPPPVVTRSRKSLRTSLSMTASQGNNMMENLESSASAASFSQTKGSPKPTENLAASLQCGLQAIERSVPRRSSFRFSIARLNKVDVGTQTLVQDTEELDEQLNLCNYCKRKASEFDNKESTGSEGLQLVPVDGSKPTDNYKMHVPKSVESVLAGSIRREMALEDHSKKQADEIMLLKHLVEKYKHERDNNEMISQIRENKIARLESLMEGMLPAEEFMNEEFIGLENEHKVLKEKYENHPDVLRLNIELKCLQDGLDDFRNFFKLGEREVLMEEIQDLRNQLQYYMDASSTQSTKRSSFLHLTDREKNSTPLSTATEQGETRNTSHAEELKSELEASQCLVDKLKLELDSERTCAEELKEALEAAMQGHTRLLEQYADLQEKHTELLSKNQEISGGIDFILESAAENGIKGDESRYIKALAAEISVLRAERERERRQWKDENKKLKAQLRDTADALEAAGEVLVRLKEAEEAAANAEERALLAEKENEKANQEIERLKKNYDTEITLLKKKTAESYSANEDIAHSEIDEGKSEQQQADEFESFSERGDTEFSLDTNPNEWFSDYDRCNI